MRVPGTHTDSLRGARGGTSAGGTLMLSGGAGQADVARLPDVPHNWGEFLQPGSLNTITCRLDFDSM